MQGQGGEIGFDHRFLGENVMGRTQRAWEECGGAAQFKLKIEFEFELKMKEGNGGKDYQGVVGTLVAIILSLSGPGKSVNKQACDSSLLLIPERN